MAGSLQPAAVTAAVPTPSQTDASGQPFVIAPRQGEPIAGDVAGALDRLDRQMEIGWNPGLYSADREFRMSKRRTDARVRDMQRTDSYAASGVRLHEDSLVGNQLKLIAKPNGRILGIDDDQWLDELQEEIEARWENDVESDDAWLDVRGMLDFTAMVKLAVTTAVMAGEAFAVAEWEEGGIRPFATCLRMIDPDRICNPHEQIDSHTLKAGIALAPRTGREIGMWVRSGYPTDLYSDGGNGYTWQYVPAYTPFGRRMYLRTFDPTRAEQLRGFSMIASALRVSKLASELREVAVINHKVRSSFAATITTDVPDATMTEIFGKGGANKSSMGLRGYMQDALGWNNGGRGFTINGVKVMTLMPNQKLDLKSAAQDGAIGTEFEESFLYYLAASFGCTKEELTKNFGSASFSALKAGIAMQNRAMKTKKRWAVDSFAGGAYRLWLEEMINTGRIETIKGYSKAPEFYAPGMASAYSRCIWIGASRDALDDVKEAQGALMRIQNGTSSLEIEAAARGQDWRDIARQQSKERDFFKRMKATYPGDRNLPSAPAAGDQKSNPDSTGNDDRQDGSAEAQLFAIDAVAGKLKITSAELREAIQAAGPELDFLREAA